MCQTCVEKATRISNEITKVVGKRIEEYKAAGKVPAHMLLEAFLTIETLGAGKLLPEETALTAEVELVRLLVEVEYEAENVTIH